jgi:activator of HSP90 ATPase
MGIIAASCEEVFLSWMSSDASGLMTGGQAVIDPRVGGKFTAWGGYIFGTTIELEPFSRIVWSWRSSEFDEGDDDSRIEATMTPKDGGTLLTIRHTSVRDGDRDYVKDGWLENYFNSIQSYFASK